MIVEHAGDLGIDPHGAEAAVAAPGQHQHERDDRPHACWAASRRPARTSSSSTSTPTPRSAGSIIAFHTANDDFARGETGLICSFGAGYSAGTVFVRKR